MAGIVFLDSTEGILIPKVSDLIFGFAKEREGFLEL